MPAASSIGLPELVILLVGAGAVLFLLYLLVRLITRWSKPRSRGCPRCGQQVAVGELDCPGCGFDFRTIGAAPPPLDSAQRSPGPGDARDGHRSGSSGLNRSKQIEEYILYFGE
jgi:hypothetical protein